MEFAFAAAAVLIGSILQRISGTGVGLVVGPTLAVIFGGGPGILMTNMTTMVSASIIMIAVRSRIQWPRAAVMVAWGLPGAVLGALLVSVLPNAVLTIVVGSVVLIALLMTSAWRNLPEVRSAWLTAATGASGGFLNATAGVSGPVIVINAQLTRWEPRAYAATLQPIYFGFGAMSVLFKSLLGVGDGAAFPPWWVIPAIIGIVLLGVFIGSRLERRVRPHQALRVGIALAMAGAISAIVRGILQLL